MGDEFKELEKEMDAIEGKANTEVKFVIGGVLIVWAVIILATLVMG